MNNQKYIYVVLIFVLFNVILFTNWFLELLHSDLIVLALVIEAPLIFFLCYYFVDDLNMSFKKFKHNKLFYISWILTIVATIFFILLLLVQYGDGEASRIGRSSRDGFVLNSFFLFYSAPSISWLIYYLANNKWMIDFIKVQKLKVHEENQAVKKAVKKSEAIKEIKEAKELLDLGVINQAEYDELANKLKPIILETKL